MKSRTPLLVFGFLTLVTGCGSVGDLNADKLNQIGSAQAAGNDSTPVNLNDASSDRASKEPDVSFLSAEAQAVLAQMKAVDTALRAKVDAICAPDTTLRMQGCLTEYEEAVSVWKDLGKTLHEACLLSRGAEHSGRGSRGDHGPGPGPGRHAGPRPGPLTDAQKQEFEIKLTSESCSQILAETQAKMQ